MKTVRRLILVLVATCSFGAALHAQEPVKFTIKEAVEYAKKHNIALQNSRINESLSKKQVKEVLADGLPQVSASLNYTNNLQIATQRLPNFINDALPPGSPRGPEFIDAQFGVAHAVTASAQLSQLIFDGTYFLGIKAAQEFVQMSEMMAQQTERDVEINTVKAYYSVLMAEKRLAMMDDNLRSLDSTLYNMRALARQGFAEMVDTARIALSISNVRIQKARLEDQRRIMLNMLKLQMGFDVNKPIALAETSESLEAQLKVLDVSTESNIKNRSEYKILDQQVKLGILDKRRYQVGYFPTIRGTLSHQQNTFAEKGKFSQLGNPWFPGTTWGVTLNVPIFTGFKRKSWIAQADLRLQQYQLNKEQFEQAYANEVYTARTTYLRAVESYNLQKQNVELAKEIKRIAKVKLQEGLGTSLEYTTAETEDATAQSNLIIAQYELMIAEIDYRKAVGGKIIE